MFDFFKKGSEILGMNARNLTYIRPHNLKRSRRLADDKIISKKMLKKAGVPVPKLIAKISSRQTMEYFDWSLLPPSFVLKPNRGYGGGGILIVYGRKKGRTDAWVKSNGKVVTVDDLKNHIANILDGAFSLSGTQDIAFFEERLKLSSELKPYAFKGIPDIRIIVYNSVPVMAMLRLPTKTSDGKANLQLGGIGVGIDMATGRTTTAVQGKSSLIEYVPDSRMLLRGIQIPNWNDILTLSIKAQQASGLGFLGADVALDRDRGPVFLELNARPGLSIQIANLSGLKRRLERVEGLNIKTAKRGATVGKNLFGGEIEEDVEGISGKKVIGSIETVTFTSKSAEKIKVQAKVDTGAFTTSIDEELARKLGYSELMDYWNTLDLSGLDIERGKGTALSEKIYEEHYKKAPGLVSVAAVFAASGITLRPIIRHTFTLDDKNVTAKINIVDRTGLKYQMIIGKRNLNHFLVDVSK